MPSLVTAADYNGPRFAYSVKGISLFEHRRRCLAKLRQGAHLVRRMSDEENGSTALTTSNGLFERFGTMPSFVKDGNELEGTIFPKGIERIKCFVIDGRFAFSKANRESKRGGYVNTMFIGLTRRLQNYFTNYLYSDQGPPGARLDPRFEDNPRFKIENWDPEEENYTIAIPAPGWSVFWSCVDSFDIEPVAEISGRSMMP